MAQESSTRPPRRWEEWRATCPTDSPVVFQKGDRVRFYLTHDTWQVVLKGKLEKAHDRPFDYKFQIVDLKYDRSPPSMPEPKDGWKQAAVVSGNAWQELLAQAAERMGPTNAGEGIYFQNVFGDGVLYRDPQGVLQAGGVEDLPDGVLLNRRYGMQEFALTFAREIEAVLAENNVEDDLICLVTPTDGPHVRFDLLDRQDRHAILCVAPKPKGGPGGGISPATTATDVTAFVVEGHVWAILKNPVSSLARLGDKCGQLVGNLFSPRMRSNKHAAPPVNTDSDGMDLAAWEEWLNQRTKTRQEQGSVRFLVDGEQFFPVFSDRLRAAQTNIHLLVCIFDNDDVAVGLADILRERSSEIDVRVILDRFSCKSSGRAWPITPMPEGFEPPKSIGAYMERGSKVRVRPFLNTWASAEHSKVYLIDETYAYIGGMNLGREYRYEWHDLMAEIEGPIVASLEWEFAKAWSHASALGDLAFVSRQLFDERPDPATEGEDWVMLRRLNTRTSSKGIRKAVLEALRRAEREVFLENPYLFSNEVIVGLARARGRGVDVRVILGTENNMFGGRGSNVAVANYLLKNGVRVFLYPGMSHIKAIYVDGWASWGSANFSGLSLKNNLEVNLATSDKGVAAELRQKLFEKDFEVSLELTEPLRGHWSDGLSQSLLNQL